MRLDDVARTGRRSDRAAEEDVVDEDEVGGQLLPHGRRVRLDPAVELGAGAVLHPLHLVALVLVEDEDREEPTPSGRTVAAPPRSYRSG